MDTRNQQLAKPIIKQLPPVACEGAVTLPINHVALGSRSPIRISSAGGNGNSHPKRIAQNKRHGSPSFKDAISVYTPKEFPLNPTASQFLISEYKPKAPPQGLLQRQTPSSLSPERKRACNISNVSPRAILNEGISHSNRTEFSSAGVLLSSSASFSFSSSSSFESFPFAASSNTKSNASTSEDDFVNVMGKVQERKNAEDNRKEPQSTNARSSDELIWNRAKTRPINEFCFEACNANCGCGGDCMSRVK